MKKLLLALIVTLSGCAVLPTGNNQSADYPHNFMSIINQGGLASARPMNIPMKYTSSEGVTGWGVCTEAINARFTADIKMYIIQDNKVISQGDGRNVKILNSCQSLKQKYPINGQLELENYNKLVKAQDVAFINNPANDALFGKQPDRKIVKELISTYILKAFKNPYTVEVRNITFNKFINHPNNNVKVNEQYVYVIMAEMNAKNGAGIYTGFKPTLIYFKNGQILDGFTLEN